MNGKNTNVSARVPASGLKISENFLLKKSEGYFKEILCRASAASLVSFVMD